MAKLLRHDHLILQLLHTYLGIGEGGAESRRDFPHSHQCVAAVMLQNSEDLISQAMEKSHFEVIVLHVPTVLLCDLLVAFIIVQMASQYYISFFPPHRMRPCPCCIPSRKKKKILYIQ